MCSIVQHVAAVGKLFFMARNCSGWSATAAPRENRLQAF
jgi:hypothetical protein